MPDRSRDTPGPSAERPPERFDMRANFEGLIQLLARNLYPEPDVFVRELIQNSHDSIRLRREREPAHEGRIEVEVRPAESRIVLRDDGLGMDRDDIVEFLSVIGATGTGTARLALEEANSPDAFDLIGQFGIGMLSAFVVAERVTVRTRKLGSEEAFVWENEGRTECRLGPADRQEVGTEIVVSVARGHSYMLDRGRIRDAIVRYCDFIPIPIFVDGEGPVNSVQAPWDRPGWPSEEARNAAYHAFVSRRYPDVPLDVIPVEIEEPVRARGALYISDRRLPDLNTAGVVDIFVRRMFVRGADGELLPEWAKFIRGVIECPDLQPTAARDNVRRDHWAYEALRNRLSELIVERLCHLAAEKPERFEQINRWHHYHLKGMALFHDDFFERVAGLLLFDSNRGLLSLVEAFRMDGGEGVDGPDRTPVFYFSQEGAAPQFHRLADARGWTVLGAGRAFERDLLAKYARSIGSGHRLVALDARNGRVLFRPPSAGTEGRCRALERRVGTALAGAGLTHVDVAVCRYLPTSLPAVVLLSPESEAERRLEALVQQPWFVESLGEVTREVLDQRERRPIGLRLNEDHGLIRQLLDRERNTADDADVLVGLFLSAALNAKDLLTGDTVEALHRHLTSLLSAHVTLEGPGGVAGAASGEVRP